ncbi:MAG: hypothetical protein CUN53_04215, partial [Phototrophicales bacterium]
MAALRERIEDAFAREYPDGSPALREADTSAKRIRLLLDVADYVLAVESIAIGADEKARLI